MIAAELSVASVCSSISYYIDLWFILVLLILCDYLLGLLLSALSTYYWNKQNKVKSMPFKWLELIFCFQIVDSIVGLNFPVIL